ncbi:MAG: hypothetical protein COB90_02795 [Hyphomicrobiales bacterium]|nr:MAG: hypothetical protein COB90_02795 [Hyphomicrobiales bacterium]
MKTARPTLLAMALLGTFLLSTQVSAGTLAEASARTESFLQSNKPVKALNAFEVAQDALWNQIPLVLKAATLVTNIKGFGEYEPKTSPVTSAGETLRIYVEPIGFQQRSQGEFYQIEMNADLEVLNSSGQVLASVENFAAHNRSTRSRVHDYYLNFEVTVPTLKAGHYVLRLKVRDLVSGKSGTSSLAFVIEGAAE